MDYKLFQKSGLLLLQKDGKFSVFAGYCDENAVTLHPFENLTNVSAVRIEERAGLIFSSNGLYDIDGRKVSNFSGTQVNLFKLSGKNCYLIVNEGNAFSYDILLWDGKQIVLDTGSEKYEVSARFAAITDNDCWHIYNGQGQEVKLAYPIEKHDSLFLGNNLVVCGTPGNYRMYSLDNKSLLCSDKNMIVCSPTKPFALCAEMSGKRVDVFTGGRWVTFDDVDNFRIIDDKHKLFALCKNGKQFIYGYNAIPEPLFAEKYPDGVSFVASDNGILLFSEEEITDGTQVNFMEKVPTTVRKKRSKK